MIRLVLSFFLFSVYATEYEMAEVRDEDMTIQLFEEDGVSYLDGPCDVLQAEISHLRDWTRSEGEEVDEQSGFFRELSREDNQCRLRIADVTPSFVSEYHFERTEQAGPNCLNASLFFSGMNNQLRYTNEAESDFLLSSPFCQLVAPGEELQPVDIGNIQTSYRNDNGEDPGAHSFIFVSDRLVWNKVGRQTNALMF